MDRDSAGGGKRLAAPYIYDLMRLVEAADRQGVDCQFYRSGHQALDDRCVDCFAVGPFQYHQATWREVTDDGFLKAEKRFADVVAGGDYLAGYIAYEMGFAYEAPWWNLRLPEDGYAWRFARICAWYEADHLARKGYIVTTGEGAEEVAAALKDLVCAVGDNAIEGSGAPGGRLLTVEEIGEYGEWDEAGYCAQVEKILEDISAGRYYELNYTQQFEVGSPANPVTIFSEVFRRNHPSRGFLGKFPDEVVGFASPELFLKQCGERVYTRPIKGSLKPDTGSEEFEKLMAEHIMVVDLARNDLGRVTDRGRVVVEELRTERAYGGLRHWESLIAGKTSAGRGELLRATLPAASITGAPKVEVVRAIADYERSARGVYTGVCGWLWPGGDFDFNVAIRGFCAARTAGDWRYRVGAGGAIVADSQPRAEYYEAIYKALPVISAIVSAE